MVMPAVLRAYLDRVDAMSLRERALIFLAAAAILVGWCFNTFISSRLTERADKLRRIESQQEEMRSWNVQLEALARAKVAGSGNESSARLSALRGQLAELDRSISERRKQLVPPDRMAELLGEVLRRNHHLQLAALVTLPPESIGNAQGQGAGQMYRHGIELTLSGGYLDLVSYLADLEHLPAKVFWGGVDLSAAYPVTTLKISLFTFSPDKTWLAL